MITRVETIRSELRATQSTCYHCSKPNPITPYTADGHAFCCNGCLSVYNLLQEGDLCQFYQIEDDKRRGHAAVDAGQKFDYLASEEIVREFAHFYTPERASVTLTIPAMHCSACMWVLEHLNRLSPAVLESRVDFIRKELTLTWDPTRGSLRDIALTLTGIGYEPLVERNRANPQSAHKQYMRSLVIKLGVVGFCTGNVMLFSFPDYLGIEHDPTLLRVFEVLKIVLTLPVVFYGASEYLKGAWSSLRQRQLSLDVPLALGILTLFVRSLADTFITGGAGFYDSLAGLVLFLLFGRWVQARSFDHLRFDQTLDDFFPLAAAVVENGQKRYQKADTLKEGQLVEVQNEMLFPADGILQEGPSLVDYSFATGESRPVLVHSGEQVFAGGKLQGKAVLIEVKRPLSRSRFTSLWNHKAFERKSQQGGFARFIEHRFAFWFNLIVLSLAVGAGWYWSFTSASIAWQAATAVLIVACPCALSLAMPFATHAGMQRLAQNGVFLRKPETIQELAGLQTIVFDKTGTLTETREIKPAWQGQPLGSLHRSVIRWMAGQSSHPLARAIAASLEGSLEGLKPHGFEEIPGQGLQAIWTLDTYRLGNPAFVSYGQIKDESSQGSRVFFGRNGEILGCFQFQNPLRAGLTDMFEALHRASYSKAVISGDAKSEGSPLRAVMGEGDILMEATPLQKLEYLRQLDANGVRAAMVGDGMNDAGAFAAASVGVAVRQDQNHFSPACDVIMEAGMIRHLPLVLAYSRQVMRAVVTGFVISLVFNAVALSLAVSGTLSPPIAALLMPMGSITVVLTSIGLVGRASAVFEKQIIQNHPTL